MSVAPEFILQQALVKGFRRFREDQRFVDTLFHNLTQSDLNVLRKFFREKSVDLCLNYPDQDLKLPAIVILLKSENESQAFLNDLMQDESSFAEMGQPFPSDEELLGDSTIAGRGSVSSVSMGPQLKMIPTTALNGSTASTLLLAEDTFTIVDPFEEDVFIVVLEGIGAGQNRQIVSIEPELHRVKITITPPWDTIPDSTSVVQIVTALDAEGITGEPSKLFTTDDVLERRGSIYRNSYHLMILAQNAELTIFLYNAIKAMFVIERNFMIKQGIMNFQMSGTDFAPRSEYMPTLAYQRALMVEFDYSFDVIIPPDEPSARYLRVVVASPDSNGFDSIGLETIIDLTPP